MDMQEVAKLLRDNKVEADIREMRDPISIAMAMGFVGLKPLCVEMTGTFSNIDTHRMRERGLIVEPTGFGQQVFEVLPMSQLANEV